MVNEITLIGFAGKDAELRHSENGVPVCRFSIATSEKYKDATGELKEETDWHNIKCYRENATNAGNMVKKGSLVYLKGKQKHTEYTDKNGVKKMDSHVLLSSFKMLPTKEKSDTPYQAPEKPQSSPQPQQRAVETANFETALASDVFKEETKDNDLPF